MVLSISRYIIAFLQGRGKWQKRLLLCFAGAMAAWTMPPWFMLPLWVPSLAIWLFYAHHASGWKQAAAAGWWWGFGFFLFGLYWISYALTVEIARFGWLIPFALTLIPAILALYGAAISGVWKRCGFRLNLVGMLAFACLYTLLEYLRGMLFTGFPWNLAGHSLAVSDALLQFASVGGVFALSLMVICAGIVPAVLLNPTITKAGRICAYLIPILLVAGLYAFGQWRLQHADNRMVEGVTLRIVQASIPQRLKWQPEERVQGLLKHVQLSKETSLEGVTAVLWSETSIPYFFDNHFYLRDALRQAVPPNGFLLSGGIHKIEKDMLSDGVPFIPYNSLFAINDAALIDSRYDKRHLVPFGEYVPFRTWLPFTTIVYGGIDFEEGQGNAMMHIEGLPPFRPLICYEAIFTQGVLQHTPERPDWFLNITNDGWFGDSAGPHQHITAARMRTIEYGIPMARVANSGISAMIDAYGRFIVYSDIGEISAMDTTLPVKIAEETLYGRHPRGVILLMVSFLVTLCVLNAKRAF